MPTRIIQTRCKDDHDIGYFGDFPEYRRAAVWAEPAPGRISAVRFDWVEFGFSVQEFQRLGGDHEK